MLTVSTALPPLRRGLSQRTCQHTYAPFTPSNSEQRFPPPSYRGCWHGVSRGFLLRYRHSHSIISELPLIYVANSSRMTGFYDPKAFITHAASLRQAFAHCAIFPTAASRRSLGRVSVPVWPYTLSGRLPIVGLVGHYPTNCLMGHGLISGQ